MDTLEGSTRYYITPHGKMPSMTSLLSMLDDGGLKGWVKRVGQEEANRVVKEAVTRGNALHDLSEKYLLNNLTRSEIRSSMAAALFNKSKVHLDKIYSVRAIEAAMYHEDDNYAGRVDAIVDYTLDDGENYLSILDHKNTRNQIDLSKKYARQKLFKYSLQLYGYARCLKKMKGLTAKKGILVVGNFNQMSTDRFVFDLTDSFFEEEFSILLDCYFNDGDIKRSAFWSL